MSDHINDTTTTRSQSGSIGTNCSEIHDAGKKPAAVRVGGAEGEGLIHSGSSRRTTSGMTTQNNKDHNRSNDSLERIEVDSSMMSTNSAHTDPGARSGGTRSPYHSAGAHFFHRYNAEETEQASPPRISRGAESFRTGSSQSSNLGRPLLRLPPQSPSTSARPTAGSLSRQVNQNNSNSSSNNNTPRNTSYPLLRPRAQSDPNLVAFFGHTTTNIFNSRATRQRLNSGGSMTGYGNNDDNNQDNNNYSSTSATKYPLDPRVASEIASDTLAFPLRRRTTSTHSVGRGGGKSNDNSETDEMAASFAMEEFLSEVEAEERRRRMEKKRRKLATQPPPRVEPTPKERLVERERQARAEKERARLKQQFALMSDRLDDDDGDDGDIENRGNNHNCSGELDSRARDPELAELLDGSVVGTMGDDSSAGNAFLGTTQEDAVEVEGASEVLGYAMERFLQERGLVERTESSGHLREDVADGTGSISRMVEIARASPTLAPAGVVLVNTADPRSAALTGGLVLQTGSSAGSSLLSELLDRDANVDVDVPPDLIPDGSVVPEDVVDAPNAIAAALSVSVEHVSDGNIDQVGNLEQKDRATASLVPHNGSDIAAPASSLHSLHSYSSSAHSIHDPIHDSIHNDVLDDIGLGPTDPGHISPSLHSFSSNEETGGHSSAEGRDLVAELASMASAVSVERESVFSHASSDRAPRSTYHPHLTAAAFRAMAALDNASTGNAPPASVRDERLPSVSDTSFGGGPGAGLHLGGALSEGTRTTVQESASVTSVGDHTAPVVVDVHQVPHPDTPVSRIEPSDSVSVNPSEQAGLYDRSPILDHDEGVASPEVSPFRRDEAVGHQNAPPSMFLDGAQSPLSIEAGMHYPERSTDAGIINRPIRTALPNIAPDGMTRAARGDTNRQTPDVRPVQPPFVEGFEFNKYNYDQSDTLAVAGDSYGDFPDGTPSPRQNNFESLQVDISNETRRNVASDNPAIVLRRNEDDPSNLIDEEVGGISSTPAHSEYGAARSLSSMSTTTRGPPISNGHDPERQPLIVYRDSISYGRPGRRRGDSTVDDLFSSIKSPSYAEETPDAEKYLASGVLARAFPERFFALLVTLIIEIPVLLMISGGSDRLCQLVGRRKYQLLMAFLPLSSAISGNCGLQGSTLTTRAVSHQHVTKESYLKWLCNEVGASCYLGLGMGTVLGLVACHASGFDLGFGFTIFVAQFISIVTAGLTGTMAPLIFTFIFRRDSGKWGGPLETAIQDIVGSFAMVVLSYHLLLLAGPGTVEPKDTCG